MMHAPSLPARSEHVVLYAKLTAVAFLWGGTFVAGRLVATEMSPLLAAASRFGLASLILLIMLWRAEGGLPRVDLRQASRLLLLGATGVCLYNVFFFAALAEMPAARTALFVAFNPIAVALAMVPITRKFLPRQQWLGIAIALIGALIVISRGDAIAMFLNMQQSFGVGELSMIAAVLSWAAYTILGRKALRVLSPLATTTYAAVSGFLLLVVAAISTQSFTLVAIPSWSSVSAIAYLAIFGTVVPFVWYYQGVRAVGPERTAVFTNLVPLFGVILGASILGEQIGLSMIAGGALVIVGVSLTNRSKK